MKWNEYLDLKTIHLPCGPKVKVSKAQPKITVEDEGKLPVMFKRQPEPPPPKADMKLIRKHFNDTGEIPAGVEVDASKEYNVSVKLEDVRQIPKAEVA